MKQYYWLDVCFLRRWWDRRRYENTYIYIYMNSPLIKSSNKNFRNRCILKKHLNVEWMKDFINFNNLSVVITSVGDKFDEVIVWFSVRYANVIIISESVQRGTPSRWFGGILTFVCLREIHRCRGWRVKSRYFRLLKSAFFWGLPYR